MTRTLQARVAELENLLASTLDADPCLTFGQLKEPAPAARFHPPPALATAAPPPQLILPEPPKGIASPGRRRAHAQETARKRAEYEQAAAGHRQAERDRLEQLDRARTAHESAVAQARERVRPQHASIDQ